MDMLRVTVRWLNFLGAPGYSNFFFAGGGGLISDAQQVADRVSDAFGNLTLQLPAGVRVEVLPEVTVIDSDTGAITDFHNIDPSGAITGAGDGGYSAASGGVINWRTNDVRFNRRIRGRTFIVPMSGNSYEDNGTLTSTAIGQLQDFADTLVSWDFDSEFGVWSRPRNGSGGVFASAVGYTVPDMSAVLRSRRD